VTNFDSKLPLVPHGWDRIDGLLCGFGDRRVAAPPSTVLLREQVHGDRVIDADATPIREGNGCRDGYARLDADADAVVVTGAGCVAGVRTADCVPILLVAPHRHWAAAVHAGWRGTIAAIAARAVERAVAAGVAAADLHAALGPSIGACCYEVSAELARRFGDQGHAVVERDGQQPHLDLRAINTAILVSAGVPAAHIQSCGPCTRCACDRYHSFRAQPGSPGRQISWIGWQGRTRPADPTPTR